MSDKLYTQAELDAAVAAALREAARIIRPDCAPRGNGVPVAALHGAADHILALITPDAQAALYRVVAERDALAKKLEKAVIALDKIKRIDNLVGVFAACERTLAAVAEPHKLTGENK